MLVNNKRLSILNIGGELSLIPGVNNLPPRWNGKPWADLVAKYPKVQYLLANDLLDVVDDGSNDDGDEDAVQPPSPFNGRPLSNNRPAPTQNLSKFSDKEAIRLVRETADDALLAVWHENEDRPAVTRAIEAQFEALAKAGEPK